MLTTPIKLAGKEYKLRYNLNALAYIEDNLGMPIASLDFDHVGAKALLVCLYAGLLWDKRTCPQRWSVGEAIVNMEDYEYASTQFATAMKQQFSKKEEEVDEDPNEKLTPDTGLK